MPGRLSFIIRIGQLGAAPMAGVAWDLGGPWGAFVLMSLWAFGAVVCALLLAAAGGDGTRLEADGRGASCARCCRALADYITAFRLLGVPAVMLIVLLGALMHVGNSVQGSFYVAWLNDMGLTGTAIGLLSPAARDRGGAVLAADRSRSRATSAACGSRCSSLWAGIVLICITPLLGSYLLLQIAMFLRSGANGLAQPLVITLVLRGAGRENQGKAIGLRGTANRIASILSPLAMGAIAEAVGLEARVLSGRRRGQHRDGRDRDLSLAPAGGREVGRGVRGTCSPDGAKRNPGQSDPLFHPSRRTAFAESSTPDYASLHPGYEATGNDRPCEPRWRSSAAGRPGCCSRICSIATASTASCWSGRAASTCCGGSAPACWRPGTVELLRAVGLGERMDREGHPHDGVGHRLGGTRRASSSTPGSTPASR